MQLVLLGRPGSGKGTLAKELVEELGVPYIGSGEIARHLAENDPETRSRLKAGLMAPEEAMRTQVESRIEAALLTKNGFLLDGFPRTMAQLVALLSWTHPIGMPFFIYVDAEKLTCIERLLHRGRPDDTPDAIERRLKDYESETEPLLGTLDRGGRLTRVFNEQDPKRAAAEVLERLH